MRIFHIITHFDIGGAERVAVNIAKSQTTGMEYHLVEVVRGNGEFSQSFIKELHDCGIYFHRSYITNNKIEDIPIKASEYTVKTASSEAFCEGLYRGACCRNSDLHDRDESDRTPHSRRHGNERKISASEAEVNESEPKKLFPNRPK